VDIDPQAVEVTKLSLLLKVLEGESQETLSNQLRLFHERALPDLSANIKCGNSLIGPDFYDGRQMSLLDEEEIYRINVFDWKAEFPEIFKGKNPGFDAVIGNPPYIRIQVMKQWAPLEVEFYKRRFAAASKGNYDIYVVFIEQGLFLLNERGHLGMIVPNKFFNAKYGEPIRKLLADGKHLAHIVHFGDEQVFQAATTYTSLVFLNRSAVVKAEITKVNDLAEWRSSGVASTGTVSSRSITPAEWSFVVGKQALVFDKLAQMPLRLGDVARLFVGLQTDADSVFILEAVHEAGDRTVCRSKYTGREHWLESDHLKPFLKGSLNVRRYRLADVTKRLIFPYRTVQDKSILIPVEEYQQRYPLTWAYLNESKNYLVTRNKGRMGAEWYGYVYKKNHTRFGTTKLLVPSIATGSCFAPDFEGTYYFVGSGGGGGGGYGIILLEDAQFSLHYLLGILNSRLMSFFLRQTSTPFRGGYIALNKQYIEQMPIRTIDSSADGDQLLHDSVVNLVKVMLELQRQSQSATTGHHKTILQRQIAATDGQIDGLVYELYGLTDEEIAIVEEATR